MITKELQAAHVTTAHALVVEGSRRREALPIVERAELGADVELVYVTGERFERRRLNRREKVRVTDKEQHS